MISNQILQNTIEGLKSITRIDLGVMDTDGKTLATTFPEPGDYENAVLSFVESPAESQVIQGYQFFKIYDEHQLEYILIANGGSEDVYMVGKIAAFQIQNLLVAYKERFDKDNFIKNLLLDNLLLVDIYNRAKKLHIDTEVKRDIFIVETSRERDVSALDSLRSVLGGKGKDFITAVDEKNIIVVKELGPGDGYPEMDKTAHEILDLLKAEGEENIQPKFPFLCLLVSGGNSQIILVKAYNEMEILGQTIDDAAGEAIDKCSKVMGLGYPGGPIIDKLARQGNPKAFTFSKPHIPGLDYSFSGLKTSFLYSLRDWMKDDPDFIEHHKVDLAASLEATVVDILMDKLRKAAKEYKIKEVAVAGGVSANNGLRNSFREHAEKYGWNIFIPKFSYTTDNAAMIAITGYFKYLDKDFCSIDLPAYSRVTL